jgi:hypothetical protein
MDHGRITTEMASYGERASTRTVLDMVCGNGTIVMERYGINTSTSMAKGMVPGKTTTEMASYPLRAGIRMVTVKVYVYITERMVI